MLSGGLPLQGMAFATTKGWQRPTPQPGTMRATGLLGVARRHPFSLGGVALERVARWFMAARATPHRGSLDLGSPLCEVADQGGHVAPQFFSKVFFFLKKIKK